LYKNKFLLLKNSIMHIQLTLSILAMSITSLICSNNSRPEYEALIASISDYDAIDGSYLKNLNSNRSMNTLHPLKYDPGLVNMAQRISFDMAQRNALFKPQITANDNMSSMGCAYQVSNQSEVVGRICFGNRFYSRVENEDCAEFDSQSRQAQTEAYGFGRQVNPFSKSVFIVRVFGKFLASSVGSSSREESKFLVHMVKDLVGKLRDLNPPGPSCAGITSRPWGQRATLPPDWIRESS
jgi:hypothetical protein